MTTALTPSTLPSDEFFVRIDEITIPKDRARDLDTTWAEALGLMIKAQGLTNAVTVRVLPSGGYSLVTGLHRLEAHRFQYLDTIRARISNALTDDEARLEEVMENLGRNDLNALDRCHHLYELKQVYERMHPQAKHGGDRKSEIKRQSLPLDQPQNEVFGFSTVTAEKIGLSERSIRLAVKIWTDLAPLSRVRLAGTDLAAKQTELKLISSQPVANQKKIIDLVLLDEHKPKNVQEALDYLSNGIVLTPTEKKLATVGKALKSLPGIVSSSIVTDSDTARLAELQKSIATLSKFFGGLKEEELDRVVSDHEERIIASLKRRGRI